MIHPKLTLAGRVIYGARQDDNAEDAKNAQRSKQLKIVIAFNGRVMRNHDTSFRIYTEHVVDNSSRLLP